jgi:hypothetical protein
LRLFYLRSGSMQQEGRASIPEFLSRMIEDVLSPYARRCRNVEREKFSPTSIMRTRAAGLLHRPTRSQRCALCISSFSAKIEKDSPYALSIAIIPLRFWRCERWHHFPAREVRRCFFSEHHWFSFSVCLQSNANPAFTACFLVVNETRRLAWFYGRRPVNCF